MNKKIKDVQITNDLHGKFDDMVSAVLGEKAANRGNVE